MHLAQTRFARSLLALTLLTSLAACGNKADTPVATQVAAKVGSEEISVHQINQVLQRTNTAGATPEAIKGLSREVLEKLIDQQLAVAQATEAKLHRSPEVVAQIEAARREILARAYLQKVASALPKPTAEDSKKYYAEHPQLFSERRIFNVQEIVVPKTADNANPAAELRSLADAGKTIDAMAANLKARGTAFNSGSATRAAEQIPLELLAQLHPLKDGQSLVLDAPKASTYVHVVSSQLAPVSEADALPRIEQFLTNQRASEAVVADIKRLRSSTAIAYLGDFSAPDSQPNQAAAPVQTGQTAIEKGLAGLK